MYRAKRIDSDLLFEATFRTNRPLLEDDLGYLKKVDAVGIWILRSHL